ncbi:MAG: hypothetical protein HDR96_01760 [Bacteroides sp.]|nr:hypothetical protein [Bacteroides sp.]
MKKIFTLLAAAALTLSASAEVIYSWQSEGPDAVKQVGGTASAKIDEARVNYANAVNGTTYYTICLCGKKGTYPESAYVNVALDQALAEGDVISVTAYRNKNESGKAVTVEFLFDGNTDNSIASTEQFANIHPDGEADPAPSTQTFTVPASAAGCKFFDMTRGSAGTNLFITKLEITRGGAEEPAPVEGETFSILGSGSGIFNKAFDNYVMPFEFDIATMTGTFKNFIGSNTTVALQWVLANEGADPTQTNTMFNSNPVSGLGEIQTVAGYYKMCSINDFNGSFIFKQDGVNFGKIENILVGVDFASPIQIIENAEHEKFYEVTIMIGGAYSKWDAEKSEWVASGENYIRFIYAVPFPAGEGGESAIEAIEAADENAPVEYYNIQGMRVNEPAAGQLVIRRQGSKVSKVIIR